MPNSASVRPGSGRAGPVPSQPQHQPQVTDARLFNGGLSEAEWIFRGTDNRIFLLCSGGGRLRLGGHDLPIAAPSIVWAPTGETGSVLFEAGAEGAALAVPDVVLGSAMPAGAIFAQVREAIARPILGAQMPVAEARKLLATIATIEQELRAGLPGAQEVVRHHLALLLLAIWRVSDRMGDRPQPSPRAIVRGFVQLLELHIRDHWTIPHYAEALGVTADRLNTAVRRATGRTPMELVHQRLMSEAATLLDGSALQITEVAEALGFKDAAYFSRFFKRMAGVSPRSHREGVASKRIRPETSYAAWP